MRVATLVVLAVLGGCGGAEAEDRRGIEIAVDRVRRSSAFTHVYARVSNLTDKDIEEIAIICDVYDKKGLALGSTADYVKNIAASHTVVGDVLVGTPNDVDPYTAECRTEKP